jgi:hypothetical protein
LLIYCRGAAGSWDDFAFFLDFFFAFFSAFLSFFDFLAVFFVTFSGWVSGVTAGAATGAPAGAGSAAITVNGDKPIEAEIMVAKMSFAKGAFIWGSDRLMDGSMILN